MGFISPIFPLPLSFSFSLYTNPLSTAPMADGVSTYQSGGAGGKFRKKPSRRSSHATPYDRPPTAIRNNNNNNNNNNNYSSLLAKLVDPASRLLYAGADRLFGVFRKRLNSQPAQRLTGTNEDPRNVSQEAAVNIPFSSYHASKTDAFTSGTLIKHVVERETVNFDAAISTAVVIARAFEDDVASPAELAKAYMGTRPTKLSPIALTIEDKIEMVELYTDGSMG